jgi:hypothetical protein
MIATMLDTIKTIGARKTVHYATVDGGMSSDLAANGEERTRWHLPGGLVYTVGPEGDKHSTAAMFGLRFSCWPSDRNPGSRGSQSGYDFYGTVAGFFKGPTWSDCAVTTDMLLFRAVAVVLGEAHFNNIMKAIGENWPVEGTRVSHFGLQFPHPLLELLSVTSHWPQPSKIRHLSGFAPAHTLPLEVLPRAEQSLQPLHIKRVLWSGLPWYGLKHMDGAARAMHGFWFAPHDCFWGLGATEPIGLEDLRGLMRHDYNRPGTWSEGAFLNRDINRYFGHQDP